MRIPSDYNEAPWVKISIEELTTPKPGYIVHRAAWWAITDDGFALLYKGSPQCNTNRLIVERIRPDCKPKELGFTFLPHRCSDYC